MWDLCLLYKLEREVVVTRYHPPRGRNGVSVGTAPVGNVINGCVEQYFGVEEFLIHPQNGARQHLNALESPVLEGVLGQQQHSSDLILEVYPMTAVRTPKENLAACQLHGAAGGSQSTSYQVGRVERYISILEGVEGSECQRLLHNDAADVVRNKYDTTRLGANSEAVVGLRSVNLAPQLKQTIDKFLCLPLDTSFIKNVWPVIMDVLEVIVKVKEAAAAKAELVVDPAGCRLETPALTPVGIRPRSLSDAVDDDNAKRRDEHA